MKHLLPALCLTLLLTETAGANPVECGGNAYSWTEVIEGRGRRARDVPYVAAPDTYCPNIIEHRPRRIDSIGVHVGDDGLPPSYPGGEPSPAPEPNLRPELPWRSSRHGWSPEGSPQRYGTGQGLFPPERGRAPW